MRPDSRHQPPAPLNNLIGDFLDIVKDARDPWLLFLYVCRARQNYNTQSLLTRCLLSRKALFLSRLSRPQEAIGVALQSIAGCPWNWSTWMLIEYCLENATEVSPGLSVVDALLNLPPSYKVFYINYPCHHFTPWSACFKSRPCSRYMPLKAFTWDYVIAFLISSRRVSG